MYLAILQNLLFCTYHLDISKRNTQANIPVISISSIALIDTIYLKDVI